MTTRINSVLVADPYDVVIQRNELGSLSRAINGTLHIDYFSTNLNTDVVIKLKWRLITSAEMETLKTQVEDCIANNRTLLLPDGVSYTVRLDPESAFTQVTVRSGGTWLYNVECGFVVST